MSLFFQYFGGIVVGDFLLYLMVRLRCGYVDHTYTNNYLFFFAGCWTVMTTYLVELVQHIYTGIYIYGENHYYYYKW